MIDWYDSNDINVSKNNLVYLDDLHGYVLPHAGTAHTKNVLNTTLRFTPTKKITKIYIIYYPAFPKENVEYNGKLYYHEFYVIYRLMTYICSEIWGNQNIEIIGKNIKLQPFNGKYENDSFYIISADFSHHKLFAKAHKLENCAAHAIMYRSLLDNEKCINEIDHVNSFKTLYNIIPKNYMLQWIGRSRSVGEKGVGYLSFLIRNPKISQANGFFVTAYDSEMRAHECLGNVSTWSKELENDKINEVLTKGYDTSRLTGGFLKHKKMAYYSVTYLFKEPENQEFIRGYHAIMTSALYLPSVFLENVYENGKWIEPTDKEWDHSGDGIFNMSQTNDKLSIKGGISNVKPTLYATNMIHHSLKDSNKNHKRKHASKKIRHKNRKRILSNKKFPFKKRKIHTPRIKNKFHNRRIKSRRKLIYKGLK